MSVMIDDSRAGEILSGIPWNVRRIEGILVVQVGHDDSSNDNSEGGDGGARTRCESGCESESESELG